eukprot:12908530-Prorocentrum_lima.AAC.1
MHAEGEAKAEDPYDADAAIQQQQQQQQQQKQIPARRLKGKRPTGIIAVFVMLEPPLEILR